MKITAIGTGYVGLVLGTCLSELGNDVICLDIDKEKIDKLNKGIIPIYEVGLSELIKRNVDQKRLTFTTDVKKAVQESDILFIAVGTPSKDDGSVDMKYIESVANSIAENIDSYKIIVNKSTVPVGTADKVKEIINKSQKKKVDFDVVSNPEFLREGAAVKDFFNPDRVIIGTDSKKAEEKMVELFKPLERTGKPIIVTDIKSAELIKYASNAFLATKISFVNELSKLCEKTGSDIKQVSKGMGLDTRIGPRFLYAGVGYGGSCFPKDVRALIKTGEENGIDLKIVKSVDEVNMGQRYFLLDKIKSAVGDLKNKKIAIWGLAFKPKTDDLREAPSLTIIGELQKLGAKIRAFDPIAKENAEKIFRDIEFGNDPYDSLEGCSALVILTEWDEFRNLDKERMKSILKDPIVIDGRNIYGPKLMKKLGFKYLSIGRR